MREIAGSIPFSGILHSCRDDQASDSLESGTGFIPD